MSLRPYQVKIIDDVRGLMKSGAKSILICAPTGSGKTLLAAHMLKTASARGLRSVFMVHRREILMQSVRAFDQVGVSHGIISAGFVEDDRHNVQIASVQTLVRRLHKITRPSLIVIDECHHVMASSWSAVCAAFPLAYRIGLTASPIRLDGQGLSDHFDKLVAGPSVSWLIENKFLAPYKLFAPTNLNTASLHTRMGDFVKAELNDMMDKPSITGDAVNEYKKRAAGRRAVVFCVSVEHSKHVVSEFAAAGFRAEHVDGETPTEQRDAAIRRFESGDTQVLSNVDLFGEGFDLPSLEVSILLRPTQSLGLYLQQVGRSLRPSPGKDHALILDHAGNCARHGLPDEVRDWSLAGRPRRERSEKAAAVSVKICPKCFAAQFPGKPACEYCGTVFEVKPRVVDQRDGELEEVTKDTLVRRKPDAERQRCTTLQDLIALGRSRNYKRPEFWAKHIFNYRQQKKNRSG